MVGLDRIVDRLENGGVLVISLYSEDVEPNQGRAGGHALDADVAGGWIRLGAEIPDVIGLKSLAGDGVGVKECLVAASGLRRVRHR